MAVTHEIVGDAVTLTYVLTPAISATVVVTVTKPDLTTATPSVTQNPTGTYTAVITADQAGVWVYKFTATGSAVDAEDGYFFVEPFVGGDLYTTVDEMKARFGITDPVDDYGIRHAIRAASRAVDDDTGRRFYADVNVSQRQFRTNTNVAYGMDGELVLVDDIASLTGLIVEIGTGSSWQTVTDYIPEPLTALAWGLPVTGLRRTLSYWLPSRQVRVTARWGWPAVPPPIREATELLAARSFKRKDAPFGVAGFADFGAIRISGDDPDVERLLGNYRLPGFA